MRLTPDHRQKTTAGGFWATPSAAWDAAALRVVALLAAGVLVAGLSGCVSGVPAEAPSGSDGQETAATTTAAASDAGPEAAVTATAGSLADTAGEAAAAAKEAAATETVKKTLSDALGRLAANSPKPATAQVTDTLTGAGIEPAALQVSQSRTPTGLEADAIEAAVLEGKDCVIGQVRDGAVTVTVLPVLASGKCFVGS
ncbi:DUF6993 domain-containing protein [Arthrobacter sp. SLBN-100]|uniref:DUF6993 domain-containing protein n=1 Tax=Arthrobacter sp. SLBN-100 TaxID=2768450 RepID=UPI001152D3BA|nr:hypothetical protein [Arthrobacter sp. SLBN-100]